MKIRGDRECKECGTRWSYYGTGSITCPQCGSLRSVGVDDRKEHTATAGEFDLNPVRQQIDSLSTRDLAEQGADRARRYVREAGFIDAGRLQLLSETYLAARELVAAGSTVRRAMQVSDDEEYYLLALLRGADQGDRPDRTEVPDSLRAARGLAYAGAVEDYRSDLRVYLDENPDDVARTQLATVDEHRKRIAALDGDVPLSTAENLVRATRGIGRYLIDDDETALAAASEHLDSLDPSSQS